MKKITLLVAAFLLGTIISFAKGTDNNEGLMLNTGIGLGSYGTPVYVGLEKYVTSDISVGGVLGYQSWSTGAWKVSVFSIGAVGNYHFNRVLNIPSQWDFYGGLNLGFGIYNSNTANDGTKYSASSPLNLGLQVGGRYYFSEKFGLNLEIGGGSNALSNGRLGVTFKL